MNLLIFKAKCPVCPKTVFHVVEPGTKKVEYFEVPETKMLVILATPEIDGKKRIALGPCQRQEPFYREGVEEPVVYFAHVRHGCVPPPVAPGTQMDTSTATVTTNDFLTQGEKVGRDVPAPIGAPSPQEGSIPRGLK